MNTTQQGEGDAEIWLVWSHEHNAWWRPNCAGYTLHIAAAGRYTKTKADEICQSRSPSRFADDPPREVAVIAPEVEQQLATRDRLAAEVAELKVILEARPNANNNESLQSAIRSIKDAFYVSGKKADLKDAIDAASQLLDGEVLALVLLAENRAATAYKRIYGEELKNTYAHINKIDAENDQLRADLVAAKEHAAILQSQVDNADVNLEQIRLIEKGRTAKLQEQLDVVKSQLAQRDPGEQANILNKQLVAELRKELDESKAQAGKAFDDNVALTAAKETAEAMVEQLRKELATANTMCAALRGLLSANGVKVTTDVAQEFVDQLATAQSDRDAAVEWRANTERILADGHAVHINMLRGTIATPTKAQILHVLGDQSLYTAEADRDAAIARAESAEGLLRYAQPIIQRFATDNPKHEWRGKTQDPWGAHRILASIAALAPVEISNDSSSGSQATASLPGPEKSAETRPHHIPEPSEGCVSPAVTISTEAKPAVGELADPADTVSDTAPVDRGEKSEVEVRILPAGPYPNVRTGGAGELEPFDLSRALKGDLVVIRDGGEVSGISLDGDQVRGYLDSCMFATYWGKDGKYLINGSSPLDLFMSPSPEAGR